MNNHNTRSENDGWYRNKRYPLSERRYQQELNAMSMPSLYHPQIDTRVYSSHIFPNGEFGVGLIPPEKKRAEDKRYDAHIVNGVKYCEVGRMHELETGEIYRDTNDKVWEPSSKLGIGLKLSQKNSKGVNRYGSKGLTGYGKKCIRNIGEYLGQRADGGLSMMGTLTIPLLSLEGNKRICKNWGDIVRRFFQKCKRLYEKHGYQFDYVSCTEIQPKRLEKYGDCGLHLHFLYKAYYVKRIDTWILPDSWVRLVWKAEILRVLENEASGVHADISKTKAQTLNYRRDTVHTSAAAYLSKYIAKGAEMIARIKDELGEEYLPKQWWSADSRSKQWLKDNIIADRGGIAEMLIYACKYGNAEIVQYCSEMTIDTRARGTIVVGYCGRLTEYGMSLVKSLDSGEYKSQQGV